MCARPENTPANKRCTERRRRHLVAPDAVFKTSVTVTYESVDVTDCNVLCETETPAADPGWTIGPSRVAGAVWSIEAEGFITPAVPI